MFHESDLLDFERQRYSRQVIVPGIGIESQIKLRQSSVLIVGCGGLGCPLAMYLASCGIGKLGIVDFDVIEMHNLQRQVIYKESDVGFYKVEKVYEFLSNLNSTICIKKYNLKFDWTFSEFEEFDLIIDCTDSIATRYILSDMSKKYKKNFICASVLKWEGHMYVFSCEGPCYRCLYPNPKKSTSSCDESGIIGPICGIFGSLLGLETIKTICKTPTTKLISYNGYTNEFGTYALRKQNVLCIACNKGGNKATKNNYCSEMNKNAGKKNILEIEWKDVFIDFEKFLIIDVRSEIQYKMFRIKNSINIPLDRLKQGIKDINSSKTILVLCKRGLTSLKGAEILMEQNFKCYSIIGGIEEYENKYVKQVRS